MRFYWYYQVLDCDIFLCYFLIFKVMIEVQVFLYLYINIEIQVVDLEFFDFYIVLYFLNIDLISFFLLK